MGKRGRIRANFFPYLRACDLLRTMHQADKLRVLHMDHARFPDMKSLNMSGFKIEAFALGRSMIIDRANDSAARIAVNELIISFRLGSEFVLLAVRAYWLCHDCTKWKLLFNSILFKGRFKIYFCLSRLGGVV